MRSRWLMALTLAGSFAPRGALAAEQARTIAIAVTAKGFEPSRVNVAKGVPLKLVVTRKTDDTCAKEIVIPEENIKAELPLDKPVTLSFTPKRAGEIRYACGMNMVTGVLVVASADTHGSPGRAKDDESRPMQGMSGMTRPHGGGNGTGCGCMHHRGQDDDS